MKYQIMSDTLETHLHSWEKKPYRIPEVKQEEHRKVHCGALDDFRSPGKGGGNQLVEKENNQAFLYLDL